MLTFITMGENLPFAVALMLLLLITILEVLSLCLGAGISHFFHGVCPDVHAHVDIDHAGFHGFFWKVLTLFNVRRVPVFILFLLFLAIFALTGLALQSVLYRISGVMMTASWAALLSFLFTMPLLAGMSQMLSKVIPEDESTAVSMDSFIGRVAVITLGKAQHGYAAEAKVKDQYNQVHYILVEPDVPEEMFQQGAHVLIVRREHSRYFVIHGQQVLNH